MHREEDGAILVMPKDLQTRLSGGSRKQKNELEKKVVNNFGSSSIFEETEDNTWDQSKVILEEFRSLQIAEQCANTLRPSCWISVWLHDLVTERVPFPKRTWSPTRTANVFLRRRGSSEYSSIFASIWSESTNAQRSSLVYFVFCVRAKDGCSSKPSPMPSYRCNMCRHITQ